MARGSKDNTCIVNVTRTRLYNVVQEESKVQTKRDIDVGLARMGGCSKVNDVVVCWRSCLMLTCY